VAPVARFNAWLLCKFRARILWGCASRDHSKWDFLRIFLPFDSNESQRALVAAKDRSLLMSSLGTIFYLFEKVFFLNRYCDVQFRNFSALLYKVYLVKYAKIKVCWLFRLVEIIPFEIKIKKNYNFKVDLG
jgi:hypothetical protein